MNNYNSKVKVSKETAMGMGVCGYCKAFKNGKCNNYSLTSTKLSIKCAWSLNQINNGIYGKKV